MASLAHLVDSLVHICLFIFLCSYSFVQIRLFRFVCSDSFVQIRFFQIRLFRFVCSDSFVQIRLFILCFIVAHICLFRFVCLEFLLIIAYLYLFAHRCSFVCSGLFVQICFARSCSDSFVRIRGSLFAKMPRILWLSMFFDCVMQLGGKPFGVRARHA